MTASIHADATFMNAPISSRVISLAVTTTAARFEIPAAFAGMRCVFTAYGDDVAIVFGGSTVAAVWGQDSSVTSEVITVHASTGAVLENKKQRHWIMPVSAVATHFSVDCAAGTADLVIEMA